MGGFQKYPIPRRIRRDYWNYNPRWKLSSAHVLLQAVLASMAGWRLFYLFVYDFTPDNSYYDPSTNFAVKIFPVGVIDI